MIHVTLVFAAIDASRDLASSRLMHLGSTPPPIWICPTIRPVRESSRDCLQPAGRNLLFGYQESILAPKVVPTTLTLLPGRNLGTRRVFLLQRLFLPL